MSSVQYSNAKGREKERYTKVESRREKERLSPHVSGSIKVRDMLTRRPAAIILYYLAPFSNVGFRIKRLSDRGAKKGEGKHHPASPFASREAARGEDNDFATVRVLGAPPLRVWRFCRNRSMILTTQWSRALSRNRKYCISRETLPLLSLSEKRRNDVKQNAAEEKEGSGSVMTCAVHHPQLIQSGKVSSVVLAVYTIYLKKSFVRCAAYSLLKNRLINPLIADKPTVGRNEACRDRIRRSRHLSTLRRADVLRRQSKTRRLYTTQQPSPPVNTRSFAVATFLLLRPSGRCLQIDGDQ
ncbi:hypothetical protein EVAR_6426_1 [Eumeta japonica]|uniref:Uncharacterized protein n=1 Tax=Eumeta variegata TaxID=151549 RepID=A0A4C1TFN1_EUMVA|nr:hypothetical protein EVAR_6426_1 [Eumeta japonica]